MSSGPALAVAALLLAACSSEPVAPAGEPALIVNPDAESREELRDVVSTALNGADVTLADDALTTESVLLIERSPRQSIDNPELGGRDLGTPQRFELVLDGRQCTLVHRNTGLRWLLLDTECAAE